MKPDNYILENDRRIADYGRLAGERREAKKQSYGAARLQIAISTAVSLLLGISIGMYIASQIVMP